MALRLLCYFGEVIPMMNRIERVVFLAAMVLVAGAVASSQQVAGVQGACGPGDVKYDARKGDLRATAPGVGTGALIYVVSELRGGTHVGCSSVTRIGMDGKWLGANCGSSYLSVILSAGEHHLCADWQPGKVLSSPPLPALQGFVAEAGKTYYFRAKAVYTSDLVALDLEPLNEDEGKLLVSSLPVSVSKTKK